MSEARDRQLARRVLRKDADAFGEFFDSLFPRLYRFCRSRLGGAAAEADIEDIVQETMLKAVRGLDGYRGEASLFTWACQICRHEIAAWRRREDRTPGARSGDPREDLVRPEAAQGAGDDDSEGPLVGELVQVAMDRLPVEYATALEGKYLFGWSVSELARHLGRTRIATQSLLARARRAFARSYRETLEGEEGAER